MTASWRSPVDRSAASKPRAGSIAPGRVDQRLEGARIGRRRGAVRRRGCGRGRSPWAPRNLPGGPTGGGQGDEGRHEEQHARHAGTRPPTRRSAATTRRSRRRTRARSTARSTPTGSSESQRGQRGSPPPSGRSSARSASRSSSSVAPRGRRLGRRLGRRRCGRRRQREVVERPAAGIAQGRPGLVDGPHRVRDRRPRSGWCTPGLLDVRLAHLGDRRRRRHPEHVVVGHRIGRAVTVAGRTPPPATVGTDLERARQRRRARSAPSATDRRRRR